MPRGLWKVFPIAPVLFEKALNPVYDAELRNGWRKQEESIGSIHSCVLSWAVVKKNTTGNLGSWQE